MQPQNIVQIGRIFPIHDAIESQNRLLQSYRCFFRILSAMFSQGYAQVACNTSMGRAWFSGCVRRIANLRRLGCRRALKQFWHLPCSQLSQLAHNKKSLWLLKSRLLLSNRLRSTKYLWERAGLPAPHLTGCSHSPFTGRGITC